MFESRNEVERRSSTTYGAGCFINSIRMCIRVCRCVFASGCVKSLARVLASSSACAWVIAKVEVYESFLGHGGGMEEARCHTL